MEKIKEIENKIDAINAPKAGGTKPRGLSRIKHTRVMLKLGSPLGITLLSGAIVLGMLTGLLFTTFTINMTGTVVLTGSEHPLFTFDGVQFETETLSFAADLTELNSGETLSFPHSLTCDDNGAWECTISFGDLSYMDDPYNQWYGFTQSVDNIELNGEPVTDMILAPGDTLTFDLVYSLHHEFVTSEDPFPCDISIVLERTDPAAIVVNDQINVAYNHHQEIDITANDHDLLGRDIVIVDYDTSTVMGGDLSQIDDHSFNIYNLYAGDRTVDVWVDVSSNGGATVVREILQIHCLPP